MRTLVLLLTIVGLTACNAASNTTDSETPMQIDRTADSFEIPSGEAGVPAIQIEVIARGDGAQPASGSMVSMHYVGTYPNGEKFDSSRDRGEPFPFAVSRGQVIRGWDVIVANMLVGDRWKASIPYQLAYGEGGHPAGIPPRQDLVFDMELLSVR